MAVAYRSSGTIVANGDAGVDMSSALPSGLAIDDIMIFVGLDADNEHFDLAMPVGWSAISSENINSNMGYTIAWKRYDGTETDWVFDTPSNAGNLVMGVIHAYSGCIITGNPIHFDGGQGVSQRGTHTASRTGHSGLKAYFHLIEDNVNVTDISTGTITLDDNQTTTQGSDGRFIAQSGALQTLETSSFTTGTNEYSASWSISLIADTNRPTIVPNTADANDFGGDDTPTLEFTGSDANDDDLEYEFEILSAIDTDVDKYVESNQDSVGSIGAASIVERGQSFTGNGDYLTKATFYLEKFGSPTGFARAYLYAHTGTFGTSSVPTGSVLATSDLLDVSTLTTSLVLKDFIFDGTVQMVNTTKYVIAIAYNQGDASNFIRSGSDNSSPTHGGNASNFSGTWSAIAGTDLIFYIEGITRELNKLSVTPDATFTNTTDGADTHPFDQPDKIDYTVQGGDALADGTWYWRCRAIDTGGTNEWSDWTVIRSFDIGAAGSISGTINASSTVTASLKGIGALKATVSANSSVSANLIAPVDISATINANSIVTANLVGVGQVKAVIGGGSTVTCSLVGVGSMSATINCSSATSGILGGIGNMSATINCGSTVTVNVVAGASTISATINGVSTVSAKLVGLGIVQASINASSGVTAKLFARGDIVATINAGSTVTCNIVAVGILQSTINANSIVTANLVGIGSMSVAVNANSVVSAILVGRGDLSATIGGGSTVTCNLISAADSEMSATINASSNVTANLDGVGVVLATINSSTTVTANLVGIGLMSLSVNASSSVSANLIGAGNIKAVVDGSSAVTVNLVGVGEMKATIGGSSNVTCNLINGAGSQISATINGNSIVTANLIATGTLKSIISGNSVVTANLIGVGVMSATVSASSVITVNVIGAAPISATISGNSTVTANLTGVGALKGVVNSSSSVTANLVPKAFMSATINSGSTVSCNLVGVGIIKATINASSIVTCNLVQFVFDPYLEVLRIISPITQKVCFESEIDQTLYKTSKLK